MYRGDFFMRRPEYKRNKRKKAARVAVVLLLLSAAGVLFLEFKVRPVTRSIALVQAKSYAVAAINETVSEVLDEMQITPESLETVSVQEGVRLTSLSTNTVQANKLKNMITLRVQEAIQDIRNKRTDVPLGTIIGSDLWGGMGPGIPVCISLSGSVSSDFEETLESGGINQTVHKLSVRVSADIHVIMPAGSGSEKVETTVLIGETVIVGKTPDGIINGHFGTEG